MDAAFSLSLMGANQESSLDMQGDGELVSP
jgi:hypothetical protein